MTFTVLVTKRTQRKITSIRKNVTETMKFRSIIINKQCRGLEVNVYHNVLKILEYTMSLRMIRCPKSN